MIGRRGLAVLLGLGVGGLAYANWRVMQLEIDISPVAPGPAAAAALTVPALEQPPEPRPLADFSEIVRRPVFVATRRPPESPAESPPEVVHRDVAPPPPPAPDVRLIGVAIDGRTRQALLRAAGQSDRWIKEGESVGGWVLESVGAEAVVLGSGARLHELRLYPHRGSASAAQ